MTPWSGAPWEPRAWQRAAVPVVLGAIERRERGIVSAVMGSGKSIAQSEVVACTPIDPRSERIVVGVPRRRLVEQLSATLERRLPRQVGRYYSEAHEAHRPVVVACYDSLPRLAAHLRERGVGTALLLADEAHQTEAATVLEAIAALRPTAAIGWTATAYRSDESETLSIWERVLYQYSLVDALRDGVLVPWRQVGWDGVGDAGDVDGICLRLIERHAHGPGLISARSIADAEEYAGYLSERGVPTEAVHSRLPAAEQESRIEALRTGALRAVVHVSMLAEGVDYPWLRWLCLRRPVGARVRFVQELGRVLRSCAGKAEALLLDPHDLLGRHGIIHEAALGEALVEASRTRAEPREDGDGEAAELAPMPPAVALDATVAWLRHVELQLHLAGCPARQRYPEGRWGSKEPSQKQLELLRGKAWALRYLPEAARVPLRRSIESGQLTRQAASELIQVLLTLSGGYAAHKQATGQHWRGPRVDLAPPPVQALGRLAEAS